MRTILAIDFDRHAVAAYAMNVACADVRCCKVEDAIATMPYADVIVGGPPCQSFSMAGKGLGELDGRNGWPDSVPKTARYRIVGNGQASKVMHELAQALAGVDPQAETVIDLFCGGGVGSVGWHGNYWQLEAHP